MTVSKKLAFKKKFLAQKFAYAVMLQYKFMHVYISGAF